MRAALLLLAQAAFQLSAAPQAAPLPASIVRSMPAGYRVLASAHAANVDGHDFYFVVLAARGEARFAHAGADAPRRPLLIVERSRDGRVRIAARNDDVVLRASDGGFNGCDPFEERHIAVRGRYFTVENGVACGAHWTDFVTFRFDPKWGGYVFDNSRTESWSLNPSNDPNADALKLDGRTIVKARRIVPFSKWRRSSR